MKDRHERKTTREEWKSAQLHNESDESNDKRSRDARRTDIGKDNGHESRAPSTHGKSARGNRKGLSARKRHSVTAGRKSTCG